MPEGQEGMPNIEGSNRPISPEGGQNVEKPISEFSFKEAWARRQKLTRQKETASGDVLAKIETDIAEVKRREDLLVGEVEQEGGLMGLDQELGILRDILNAGQLSPIDIHDALKIAPQLDNLAGIDFSDSHAGIREWYYRKNIDEITDDLRQKGKSPVPPKKATTTMSSGFEESGLALSSEKQEQLLQVRSLLDQIEKSNRDSHDLAITSWVRYLETSLDKMDPEVAIEVRARLIAHDSSELIKQASGWIARESEKVGYGLSVGSAAAEADKRRHSLDRETIDLLLKKGLPGFKISEAWDWIQEANFIYPKLIFLVNQAREQEIRDLVGNRLTDTEVDGLIQRLREKNRPAYLEDSDKNMLISKGINIDMIPNLYSIRTREQDIRNLVGNRLTDTEMDGLIQRLREKNRPAYLEDSDKNMLISKGIKLEDLPDYYQVEGNGFELRDDEISAGIVPTNYYTDSNGERKRAVEDYIIGVLGGDDNAKKSFQLAEKLTVASLETSVFNRTSTTGNDQLAEVIGLKGWRAGREKTGRARGPQIHEGAIEGFGTSWLRLQTKGADVEKPVFSKNINAGMIREGSWAYYCTVTVTRYHMLRELLLDTAPKPSSIDKKMLQQAVVYFNTADNPETGKKCGPKKLRVLWLLGVVDSALSNIDLEWTAEDFAKLERAATKEVLSPDAGTFVTSEQWNYLKRITGYTGRIARIAIKRAGKSFVEGVFSSGASSGGKRRK